MSPALQQPRNVKPSAESFSENDIRPADLLAGQAAAFARDIERLLQRADEFVRVRCPACDAHDATMALVKYGFTFARCNRCLTLYMNPRPSPAVMAAYYANSENYQYWAKHIFPASESVRREKIHRPRMERIVALCARWGATRDTLVEVGAGFGTFCEVAKSSSAFRRVVAIEPTPEMVDACRARGVETIGLPLESCTHTDIEADVVVAFEVIEHVFEPRAFLRQCAAILRPGGLLVLTCPNGRGFDVELLGAESNAIDAEHVNLFNPRSFRLLVERAGFRVLDIETPGRLDAELVRRAILEHRFSLKSDSLLHRALIEEWADLGPSLQGFIIAQRWSSHMWLVAQRIPSAAHPAVK